MSQPERPVIGFLTDFGLDGAAATCKGVMLSICRDAQIVDVAHTVRKYAIRDGAFVLRAALPYLSVGTHVAVVDPGVGTSRRPIGIRTGRGDVLIGPDNGLLIPPAEALGGIEEARELANRDLWLPVTTSTFHGRDIFAPVAGHLANGDATFDDIGPSVPVDELVRLPEPEAIVTDGAIDTVVTYVDSFGNVRLAGGSQDLVAAFGSLTVGNGIAVSVDGAAAQTATFERSFGAIGIGAAILYVDSSGNLALAINQGEFAARHQVASGAAVQLRLRS